jgi:hypothetical protein
MGNRTPKPICGAQVGPNWIDDGTMCQARSPLPGPTGPTCVPELSTSLESSCVHREEPTLLESLRQSAIIGSIIGIREAIANLNVLNPGASQAVADDNMSAQLLLVQGNYQRAFEVATGFSEYFDIQKQGKAIGSSKKETGAVMIGQATGFNQAMETAQGKTLSGDDLKGFDRFATGVDALSRIAATTMMVDGGVQVGGRILEPRIVSSTYRFAGRDIVVVETSVGRQAFYRSSGFNSGMPGRWFPVDEFFPGSGWWNKAAYTQGPGLEPGAPLHRLGTPEFARISMRLGRMSIPTGQEVLPGKLGSVEMTMNQILDFYGARTTDAMAYRPVPNPPSVLGPLRSPPR